MIFHEKIACLLITVEHFQAYIAKIGVVREDKRLPVFTINIDVIAIPGAQFTGIGSGSVPKCDLKARVKPLCPAHVLKRLFSDLIVFYPFHFLPPFQNTKAPKDVSSEAYGGDMPDQFDVFSRYS
jgi:hypothetical protein